MRALALIVALAVGCGSEVPRAQGVTPYLRCNAVEPPQVRDRLGSFRSRISDRILRLDTARTPVRIGVATGPAPARADEAGIRAAVSSAPVDLLVLLGGFGDDAESAKAFFRALAGIRVPAVLVPGARDELSVLDDAFDELSSDEASVLVDARGLRGLRIGRAMLGLLAGTAAGRESRTDGACGYGAQDLTDLRAALSAADGSVRLLLAWQAPSGPISRLASGLDGGDPALAQLVSSGSVRGGVYAWPPAQARRVLPTEHCGVDAIAGPIAGRTVERGDGSYAPAGIERFVLTSEGLEYAGP